MTATADPVSLQRAFFACNPNIEQALNLFDYLPSAYLYVKNRHSQFVRLNAAMQAIYGLAERQMLGKTDRDFHPPALAEAYLAEDRRVMEGRQAIPNQVWLVPYLHGPPQWFVSSKTPLFDASGEVVGLAGVMYPIETPAEQKSYFQELLPVIRYLEEHFGEKIRMQEMAALADLSWTHFNRRFRVLLRMTPSEYLLALRVQAARRMLTETSQNMAEIAARTGFYDQSHFTKRFRQATGMTPLAYRKRFRHSG